MGIAFLLSQPVFTLPIRQTAGSHRHSGADPGIGTALTGLVFTLVGMTLGLAQLLFAIPIGQATSVDRAALDLLTLHPQMKHPFQGMAFREGNLLIAMTIGRTAGPHGLFTDAGLITARPSDRGSTFEVTFVNG